MAKKGIIRVEVYYGYYLGNTKMWDTEYVEIAADTPEDKIEEVAIHAFHDCVEGGVFGNDMKKEVIAFIGLFNVKDEEDVD